jgi:hypothetical protein
MTCLGFAASCYWTVAILAGAQHGSQSEEKLERDNIDEKNQRFADTDIFLDIDVDLCNYRRN